MYIVIMELLHWWGNLNYASRAPASQVTPHLPAHTYPRIFGSFYFSYLNGHSIQDFILAVRLGVMVL